MKSVSKSQLKAKMFEHFRDLENNGGTLIVTDYGRPTLKIEPIKQRLTVAELFAEQQGKVTIDRAAALEPTTSEWGIEE